MRYDDPYLFDDVDVLKNKLGIKNYEILEQYEADTVTARMIVLRKSGFHIESIFDIKKYTNLFLVIFLIGQAKLEQLICVKENKY